MYVRGAQESLRPLGVWEGEREKDVGWGLERRSRGHGSISLQDFIIMVHKTLSIIINCRIQRNLGCLWV